MKAKANAEKEGAKGSNVQRRLTDISVVLLAVLSVPFSNLKVQVGERNCFICEKCGKCGITGLAGYWHVLATETAV